MMAAVQATPQADHPGHTRLAHVEVQTAMPKKDIITCPTPPIDTYEKHGYLFGYPIAHSLSPLFHQTVFNRLGYNWGFFLLPSTDMDQFLRLVRDPRLLGSAVTMPHKVAIIPHLDGLTDEGRLVGAVNTIVREGDKLIGTNTDTIGIRESFLQNVPPSLWADRPGMVVGGGGAARSAVYALVKFMKCKTVYLVNRDPAEIAAVVDWCTQAGYGDGLIHVQTPAQAESLEGPGAIVACVPDFAPVTEAEITARATIEAFLNKPHKGAMLEMCYHPSPWTQLGKIAETAGWQVILGTEAMIYQGLAQQMLWHGKTLEELPVTEVKAMVAKQIAAPHV